VSWDGTVPDRLVPGVSYREYLQESLRHATEDSFRASEFFRLHGAALESLLREPWIHRHPGASGGAGADPVGQEAPSPLRLAHWNIEKGKALAGLKRFFACEPRLREADLICLNEVDCGTARAGNNSDVAWELAQALGRSAIYLPSFIECTKGWGEDLLVPGENRLGLHGLAMLTRLPVVEARAALLPPCFDYFAFSEKRFGFRQGLYARLDWQGRPLIAATTHLEVRRTPRCRARQFAAFLDGLRRARRDWGSAAAVVVTGDWNTNSFRRGALRHAAAEFVRIVGTAPAALEAELVRPLAREPLFALLREAGLELEPFNDRAPTAAQDLGASEDLASLPRPVAALVSRLFGLSGRVLRMRLDWIAASGLRPRSAPWTLDGMTDGGLRLSDHAVIGVELEPSAGRRG